MIWVGGRVVPESDLAISVADRTFEHGLGLFETLRTWGGHPTLLTRHLARMSQSARALGLPLDPALLPDAGAVAELRHANQIAADGMLRITMSGGTSSSAGSVVWMRSHPLPQPMGEGGARLGPPWSVLWDDPVARHKSLNYWRRRLAYEDARSRGFDESLSMTPDGRVWEGSRTNLFWVLGGRLLTPPREGPIVPGVMRGLVMERARASGVEVVERDASQASLSGAEESFLTNSVRGVVPVRLSEAPVPGPLTARLWLDLLTWLERGGTPP